MACLLTVTVAWADDDGELEAIDDLLERGRGEAALARVEALLASPGLEDRNLWRAQLRQGVALIHLGRPAEAVPPLEAALAIAPGDATVHLNLGRARRDLGQRGRAVADFQAALALRGTAPLWRLEYAALLAELGAPAEAVREIERARAECADCTAALAAAADLHLEQRDYARAVPPLRELVRRGGEPALRQRLVIALWNSGDAAGVVATLDSLATDALDPDELLVLAQADREVGRVDRAQLWAAEPARGLPPGWHPPARFWALVGEVCLRSGDPAAALRAIDRALVDAPTTAVYHHNRAAALVQLGRADEARRALARAQELDPDLGADR